MTSIITAAADPKLLRPRNWHHFAVWEIVLRAMFGLPMDSASLPTFQKLTGRTRPPAKQVREAWLVVGRRGGKSFITALIAVYLACFRDYKPYLAPGERGTLMILAADRKQARVIFRYIMGMLNGSPMLKRLILAERAESIDLSNSISIEIHTASFKSVRGYTVIGALCDEIAFWHSDDGLLSASETINALRPAMVTIPGAMLIALSSPYSRTGPLWETYRDNYGKDSDDILVVQADTRSMNPTVPQSFIDKAFADDPLSAAAEFGGKFRSDVDTFLSHDLLEKATVPDRHELPFIPGTDYVAFADPSGGGSDSFTLGIAHRSPSGTAILDVLRGKRPPFDPKSVVKDFASILKAYKITRVLGDRYAGEWVVSAFREFDTLYEHSELTKSEIYLECEPAFAQGAVELLDHRTLRLELQQLERRTTSGGRDRVDHPPRGHDDFANAAAGAIWRARTGRVPLVLNEDTAWVASAEDREEAVLEWAMTRGFPIY